MLRGEGESMTIGANEDARFLNGLRAQRIFAGQQSPLGDRPDPKGFHTTNFTRFRSEPNTPP